MPQQPFIPRLVETLLPEILADFPAALLVGPRASGKTTIAARFASTVLRLDRPLEAQAVAADPDAALVGLNPPILLDEWQVVPSVMGAVKRSVDQGAPPGTFLLTGSTAADLSNDGWPMTGRVVRLPMWGLVERERTNNVHRPSLIDVLRRGETDRFGEAEEPLDLRGYVERALLGGFPEVVSMANERSRARWLASYVDQVVRRDVATGASVTSHRDPVRMRKYLQAIAANTAGTPEHRRLYDAVSIERTTALAYDSLFEHLFVTEQIPAWSANQLSRLTVIPKRHLVDAALMGPLLGVDLRAVLRNADLLGRVIETYVVAQIRAELSLLNEPVQMYHLRTKEGREEIDIVLEFANGDVIGIEIKASSAPEPNDARHLRWLQQELGERFVAGVLFHTGPRIWRHEPDIHYLPISALWGVRT
jgi:uncharacterized protein